MRNPVNSSVCLTDEVLIRMAKELGIEIPAEPVKDDRIKISAQQYAQIKAEGGSLGAGFVRAAVNEKGGMRRFGHRVWKLEREADADGKEQLYLKRMEQEKV